MVRAIAPLQGVSQARTIVVTFGRNDTWVLCFNRRKAWGMSDRPLKSGSRAAFFFHCARPRLWAAS